MRPFLNLVVLSLVAVATSTSSAGCFGCNTYSRLAAWQQEGLPVQSKLIPVEYRYEDLWGSIWQGESRDEVILQVFAEHPLQHDEFVDFAEAMFRANNWTAPELDGTEINQGCEDEF